ncbi:protein WALLS ARE THIN 1 [Citrus sinensis]|uniref:Protein WALLS ARE THIN 1 n=1 Tax=Citrus sinensis TaxID=2711 RepID=A0ACB8KXB6_CITSI|nr:protein WALLS ARE THIN 1 [Citrus sinensis]
MADTAGSVSTRRMCSVPEKLQLHLAMVALQFGYAGFHVVSRAALNMGISKLVFPVYRNIIAFLLLLPFAYFLEKYIHHTNNPYYFSSSSFMKERPAMTLNFALQFILLALVGIEKVRLDRKDGIAKVVGTLFCVAGATVITLYKGPTIYSPAPPLNQIQPNSLTSTIFLSLGDAKGKNWTLGCVYLIGHCLSWSGWLVMQAPVLKKYPARLSVTAYTCFFGLIQFMIIAAIFERNLDAWIFHNGGEVFSILYAGVVASGIAFAVQIWCIDRGGPVFVAVYQPVQTLVVAIMASFALGEEFYLGGYVPATSPARIIGAVLIVVGLYLVLWGKSEEKKFASKEKVMIQSTQDHAPSELHPCLKRFDGQLLHRRVLVEMDIDERIFVKMVIDEWVFVEMVMDKRIIVEMVLDKRVFDNVLVGKQMVTSSSSDLHPCLMRFDEQLLDEILPR